MSSALQVSEHTSDLIDSYDKALNMVPVLSEKLDLMQAYTTEKSIHLQNKMKQLLEGYEHIENVSSVVR
jgi:hypothetical protein